METETPFDHEALCRSMLEHNSETISIRNPEIAIKKLTVIIDAALRLSNKKGFQAMSLRDLSKESGVSMGGLYAYFDTKTTLLGMILGEVTRAVERELSNPPKEVAQDPIAHLNWLIEHHIRLTDKMSPWFIFAFMEAKSFPLAERRIATQSEELTERYFSDVCEQAHRQGLLRPGVPQILPMLIKPLIQDWYVKRPKYRRRGISLRTYILSVQALVMAAILPNAEALAPDRREVFYD